MRTTKSLLICVLTILFLSGCAEKTEEEKVYHVGILSGLDFFATTADGFKEKMAELGYVEGQNITYDMVRTNFDPETEQATLDRFVAEKVDLILTIGTEVSVAAKQTVEGTCVPMIFTDANVEGVDLVKSIRAPGGTVTGVRYPGPDIAVKRFEVLLKIAPNTKTVLIPYQRGYPIVASELEVLYEAASAKNVTLIEIPADNAEELQEGVDKYENAVDASILMIPEPIAAAPPGFLVLAKFSDEHNMPLGGAIMSVEGYESLFGVAVDNVAVGKLAAPLADKIFKGIPAGTIPVVSSESYMQINYKAIQEEGLTADQGLLITADEIILP